MKMKNKFTLAYVRCNLEDNWKAYFGLFFLLILASCSQDNKNNKATPSFDGINQTPTINMLHVSDCISQVLEPKIVEVKRQHYFRCSSEDNYFNGLTNLDVHYDLSVVDRLIKVDLGNVYFVPVSDEMIHDADGMEIYYSEQYEIRNDIVRLKGMIESNMDSVNEFFKKHGLLITANYLFEEDIENIDSQNSKVIYLSEGIGRSSKKFWILGGEDISGLIIHELGHWLGLPDRYEELEKCPNRDTVVNNLDIMRTHNQGLNQTAFNQTDVKSIINPLCERNIQYNNKIEKQIFKDLFFHGIKKEPIDNFSDIYPEESTNSKLKVFALETNINSATCKYSDNKGVCLSLIPLLDDLIMENDLHFEGIKNIRFKNWVFEKPVIIHTFGKIDDAWDNFYANYNLKETNPAFVCAKLITVRGFKNCNIDLDVDITNNAEKIKSILIEAKNRLSDFDKNLKSEIERQAEIYKKIEQLELLSGKKIRCPSMSALCDDGIDTLITLFNQFDYFIPQDYIVLSNGSSGSLDFLICKIERGIDDLIILKESAKDIEYISNCKDALLLDYSLSLEEIKSLIST